MVLAGSTFNYHHTDAIQDGGPECVIGGTNSGDTIRGLFADAGWVIGTTRGGSRIDRILDYHFPHEATSIIVIAAQSWGGAQPNHMGMYFSGVTAINFISTSGGSRTVRYLKIPIKHAITTRRTYARFF